MVRGKFKKKQKPVKRLTLPEKIRVYPYYITKSFSDPKKGPEEIINLIYQQDIESGLLEESKSARSIKGVFISRKPIIAPEHFYFPLSQMKQIAKDYSGRFIKLEEAI
jgi:hypothetical protein|tara:strand:- start:1072 stop:1395 length:324 start_codon:yes stop_codon:yes gene_type:complete